MDMYIDDEERLIIKATLLKLELESIVPPLTPREEEFPMRVKEREDALAAFHRLCEKTIY